MNDLVKAVVSDICPTPYGYAVFLSAGGKTFVVYVDRSRGATMQAAYDKLTSERPLTHEFVMQMLRLNNIFKIYLTLFNSKTS